MPWSVPQRGSLADWTVTDEWENVHLGGKRIPGVVRCTVKLRGGLNVKKARGAKCGRIKDEGTHAAEVSFEVVLLPEDLWLFEMTIIPMLRPRDQRASRIPLSLVHPNARAWGIDHVMIDDIDSPMPEPGGTWTVGFTAVQWGGEAKKIKKPAEGAEEGSDFKDPQPEIDKLKEQRKSRAAEAFAP